MRELLMNLCNDPYYMNIFKNSFNIHSKLQMSHQ